MSLSLIIKLTQTISMNIFSLHWQVLPDATAVAQEARRRILTAADQAIEKKGCFKLVLAGGSTPKMTYQLLRESQSDWRHWHIYYGDERCLPVDESERNSVMAWQAWLAHVAIPATQIHSIPAELGAVAGGFSLCSSD
jgi:6-phosphogluconolactonase